MQTSDDPSKNSKTAFKIEDLREGGSGGGIVVTLPQFPTGWNYNKRCLKKYIPLFQDTDHEDLC